MKKQLTTIVICMTVLGFNRPREIFAQEVIGDHEIRWLRVGELRAWYSNCGVEVEYGRRGRACCSVEDQTDNMYWPALYLHSDKSICKGLWLGTTNFNDPVSGESYAYKVVQAGPRFANMLTNFMPEPGVFKMIGRFQSPVVTVDGEAATDNNLNDQVDEIDPTLLADRVIVSELHSNIGITITRKIMAFSQQYHQNYHIIEYVLKNTGIIDAEGTMAPQNLSDVYLFMMGRHGPGWEAAQLGWRGGSIRWGRNTLNHVFGQNPGAGDFEMRGYFSYYGPHSGSGLTYEEDWGAPRTDRISVLGAPAFIGAVTLHADKGPGNPADDPYQPTSTPFLGADAYITQVIDSYDETVMTNQYMAIVTGHPAEGDHATQAGDDFADTYGSDPGGYIQCLGYGPYNLEVGESVRIVIAEAVDGLDRAKSLEVGSAWYQDLNSYTLPSGETTADRNEYKKAWVWTAEDSIMQTYRRAMANYQCQYNIPQPPPPPETFTVFSGANRIVLTWADNAVSTPHFGGYGIYRATGRVDTLYTLIFECDVLDAVHQFEDRTVVPDCDYYYFIVTKGDGSQNNLYPGIPLISSKYWTLTNRPARLLTTDVASDPKFPEFYSLEQNFPNPFNPVTTLRFSLPAPQSVNLALYDRLGRQVKILIQDELYAAGVHTVTLRGEDLESGLYLCRIRAGIWSAFRKLIVVK